MGAMAGELKKQCEKVALFFREHRWSNQVKFYIRHFRRKRVDTGI